MAETKRVTTSPEGGAAADRASGVEDGLRAENERLHAELAQLRAEKARLSTGPGKRPFLSEGERQDLELHGVTTSPFTGERLTAEGEGVETKAKSDSVSAPEKREPIRGFDYVYPSVAPGKLDPAITGEK